MIRPPGAPGQVFDVKPDPGQGVPAQVRDLPDDLETPDLFGSSRLSDGAISHLSDNIVLLRHVHALGQIEQSRQDRFYVIGRHVAAR